MTGNDVVVVYMERRAVTCGRGGGLIEPSGRNPPPPKKKAQLTGPPKHPTKSEVHNHCQKLLSFFSLVIMVSVN